MWQRVRNTIPALEDGCPRVDPEVEMDILLTKDLQFVVMHDYNLKRLAGIDRRVQDMTLAEVEGLTVHQDGLEAHAFLPLTPMSNGLKELGVKLLVELKLHGGEPDNYAQIFINLKMRQLEVWRPTIRPCPGSQGVMRGVRATGARNRGTGYVIPIQPRWLWRQSGRLLRHRGLLYQDYLADDPRC